MAFTSHHAAPAACLAQLVPLYAMGWGAPVRQRTSMLDLMPARYGLMRLRLLRHALFWTRVVAACDGNLGLTDVSREFRRVPPNVQRRLVALAPKPSRISRAL